jgi:hypothetical protein
LLDSLQTSLYNYYVYQQNGTPLSFYSDTDYDLIFDIGNRVPITDPYAPWDPVVTLSAYGRFGDYWNPVYKTVILQFSVPNFLKTSYSDLRFKRVISIAQAPTALVSGLTYSGEFKNTQLFKLTTMDPFQLGQVVPWSSTVVSRECYRPSNQYFTVTPSAGTKNSPNVLVNINVP